MYCRFKKKKNNNPDVFKKGLKLFLESVLKNEKSASAVCRLVCFTD